MVVIPNVSHPASNTLPSLPSNSPGLIYLCLFLRVVILNGEKETMSRASHKREDAVYARQMLDRLVAADRRKNHEKKNRILAKERKSLKWNVEKVKQVLHDKIISRVRRPQDTMRVAYKVFGAPKNGINRARSSDLASLICI